MATRSGTVDPGILFWLIDAGLDHVRAWPTGLQQRSGLLGLAGTADIREVEAGRGKGAREERANGRARCVGATSCGRRSRRWP